MGRGKSQRNLDLIDASYDILREIQPATIRAVCYRLFVTGFIESMAKTCTNRVSAQLVDAREAGIIPWEWIVDETRHAERLRPGWADPEAFIRVVQDAYRRDYWEQQPRRVEVWSEKGTVRGTLAPVLGEYGVTFRVLHGYASATTVHAVAEATREMERPLVVLYCGDWDPSGLHMSAVDLPARLDEYDANVDLWRVALDEHDIEYGGLPSFQAETKRGDSRWAWFTEQYGQQCWELDALSPVLLRDRVAEWIRSYIDQAAWTRCIQTERVEQESLRLILGNWRHTFA
jgi:hypothetical protein